MKKIISILEAHGVDDSLIAIGRLALRGFKKESFEKLTRLCRTNEKLKAIVLVGAIGLYSAARLHATCLDTKNLDRSLERELKRDLDSIDRVYLIDNSIDRIKLIGRAAALRKNEHEHRLSLSSSMTRASEDHKGIVRQILDAVKAETTHSDNAARGYLASFLNNIGFTTIPKRKPFTRQNISK